MDEFILIQIATSLAIVLGAVKILSCIKHTKFTEELKNLFTLGRI